MVGGTNVAFDPATSSGSALGKTNVIPREAYVTGDIRFLTAEQFEATRARMEAIVADHLPRTSASIEVQKEYPSMAPTDGNRKVLAVLDAVSRDLGAGPIVAQDPGRTWRRRHLLRLHGAPLRVSTVSVRWARMATRPASTWRPRACPCSRSAPRC